MSPTEIEKQNARALSSLPNLLVAASVLLLFVALRLLDAGAAQTGVLVVAGLCFAAAGALRFLGRLGGDDAGKQLSTVAGVADALVVVGGVLVGYASKAEGAHEAVLPAGLLLLCVGVALVGAIELSERGMRATGAIDIRRIKMAAAVAATAVLGIGMLAGVNYAAHKSELRVDFSFAAPTTPTPATRSVLDTATCTDKDGATGKPEVFLFFERGSSALGEVRDYFDGLAQAGAVVVTQDSAIDPALAKALKISKNGTVGFRCGERTESYTVGDDRDDAQKKLKKLDEEVRTRLAKVTRDPINVYATVGHGERPLDSSAKPGDRLSARGIKELLQASNAKLKKLGIADGLGNTVPADAGLVVVAGPTELFLPEEAAALAAYVERGGALLLLVDPVVPGGKDVAGSLEPLLSALGVKLGTHEVLNDKEYVKRTNTAADHAFLFSTSFGSHKSVKDLAAARGEALLFLSATTVEKRNKSDDAAGKGAGPRISMIARSRPSSFIDANDDRAWQEGQEARAVLDLAAAVEIGEANKDGQREGRAIVVGDSDTLADMLVGNKGNVFFGAGTLAWLLRDDAKAVEGMKVDEDVPIRHTPDQDKFWFYSTIVGGPFLVGVVGRLVLSTRRRKRPAPATTTTTTNVGGAA